MTVKDTSPYLDLPNVQEHITAASLYAAKTVAERVRENVECYLVEQPIGSPIEAIFMAWWEAYSEAHKEDGFGDLCLHAQPEIKLESASYRLDFSVFSADVDTAFRGSEYGLSSPNIGIELDGHNFHERTKEQVAYRNKRDRDLMQAGWMVFHFSGSELARNPLRAVEEVWEAGERAYGRLFRAVYDEDRRRGRLR